MTATTIKTTNYRVGRVFEKLIGCYALLHGILNMVFGNDFYFGVLLVLIFTVFFLPIFEIIKKTTGISLHYGFKILLALIVIWVTLAGGAVNEGYWPEITE